MITSKNSSKKFVTLVERKNYGSFPSTFQKKKQIARQRRA